MVGYQKMEKYFGRFIQIHARVFE